MRLLTLITIAFLLVALPIKAQKLRLINTKFYCNGHNETFSEIYDIIQTSDKGFALTGTTEDTGGGIIPICHNTGKHPLFGKLDSSGNVQWIKVCDTVSFAFSICQTPDGGYASSGRIHSYPSMNIFRYDNQGSLLWYREYGKNALSTTVQIINTPDHGFLLLGSAQGQDADIPYNYTWPPVTFQPNDWVIMKLDSFGNKQWVRVLGTSGFENTARILAIKNNYYLIGQTISKDHECADTLNHAGSAIYTIKLDSAGNTIWSKANGWGFINQAIYDENDQTILITGRSRPGQEFTGGFGKDDVFLMKIDTSGNYKWGKLFGTSSDDQAYGLCKGNTNNYLLLGMSYDDVNLLDRGIMVNIDSAGGLLDQKIVTGDGGITFLGVFPVDGNFAGLGISFSKYLSEGTGQNCPYGLHGSGALTLSKLGLWKTNVPASTPPSGLQLVPNPARNSFEVKFSGTHLSGQLTCLNSLGKSVFVRKIASGENTVKVMTGYWPAGNYVVCWQPNGGIQICSSISIY